MKIACLPSNQHLNGYAGIPGATEEKWAVAVSAWVVRRLNEFGAEARLFHVPGQGAKSTDELQDMLDEARYWGPDYMLSVHSDAVGDKAQTGILMLMPREIDRYDGITLGKAIAARVGLPYKGAWVYGNEARKINYLMLLRATEIRGCLVEVGEHATVLEAKWNWSHTKEIGVGIADALADYLKLGGEDEMTKEERNLLRIAAYRALGASIRSEAVIAQLRGDTAKADELLAKATADVAKEKA
ncbi:MAG: N-acetylmuramoyl-L-alanine amidase, partial [Actinobacteria bacterium]|nr:N-acetylmuramoyl-L-alanine amidase [Actinomycetota bacterium]